MIKDVFFFTTIACMAVLGNHEHVTFYISVAAAGLAVLLLMPQDSGCSDLGARADT